MRLGMYKYTLRSQTKAHQMYHRYKSTSPLSCDLILEERHRHRYETKWSLFQHLSDSNVVTLVGLSDGNVVEAIETPVSDDNNYWFGVQFHPEYLSSNRKPHWVFLSFINAAITVNK